MSRERMSYPAQSSQETRRQRFQRLALTRRAQAAGNVTPEPPSYEVRIASDGSAVMSLGAFRAFDYGRVCQMLGLSPSRPDRAADGSRRKGRRGTR